MTPAATVLAAALTTAATLFTSAAWAQATSPADTSKPANTKPAATGPSTAKPAAAKPVAKRNPPVAAKPTETGGPTGSPALLGQYGDWGAYWAGGSGSKVCFVLAKPATSQTKPANRPRNPVYFFVASRPAENVKNEVSVVVGYPFESGTDASVEIGAPSSR